MGRPAERGLPHWQQGFLHLQLLFILCGWRLTHLKSIVQEFRVTSEQTGCSHKLRLARTLKQKLMYRRHCSEKEYLLVNETPTKNDLLPFSQSCVFIISPLLLGNAFSFLRLSILSQQETKCTTLAALVDDYCPREMLVQGGRRLVS